MKQLYITNSNKPALLDDEDYKRCWPYTWFVATSSTGSISIRARINGNNSILLARFVLNDFTADNIDHIDRDPFNNQRTNIRPATFAQNARNRKPQSSNTTGYKGVSKNKNEFRATIRLNNKNKYLGTYKTAEEAAEVYNKYAAKYFGDFAYINEIRKIS